MIQLTQLLAPTWEEREQADEALFVKIQSLGRLSRLLKRFFAFEKLITLVNNASAGICSVIMIFLFQAPVFTTY